jgi:hypothetical protein
MAGRTRSGPRPLAYSDAHDVRARIYHDVILEWYRYPPGPAGTVPSHSHEEYQLCLCLGSASRYPYRGGWIVVPPGTLSVLMPGEVLYNLRSGGPPGADAVPGALHRSRPAPRGGGGDG